MAFIDELFELIVKRLKNNAKNYSDGDELSQNADSLQAKHFFDYEKEIKNAVKAKLRSDNLQRFLTDIIENIIMKNIDKHKILSKLTDCK